MADGSGSEGEGEDSDGEEKGHRVEPLTMDTLAEAEERDGGEEPRSHPGTPWVFVELDGLQEIQNPLQT